MNIHGPETNLSSAVIEPDEIIAPSAMAETAEYPAQSAEHGRLYNFTRNRKARAGAALLAVSAVAGFGADRLLSSGGDIIPGISSAQAAAAGVANANCEPLTISYASYSGHPDAIVPSTEKVTDTTTASEYSQNLFNNGPLGHKVDPAGEATIYALMGKPAKSNGTDTENNVHADFENAFQQMTTGSSEDQAKAAATFCDDNQGVVGETVGYSDTAIPIGSAYTEITGVVGADGHIDDIKLNYHNAARSTFAGVTYEVQDQSGLYGFDEVVIPRNGHGTIDVVGLRPNPNQGNGNTPNNSTSSPNTQTTNPNGGSNTGNSGSAGGSSPNESKGNAGGAGTQAEGTNKGQSGTGNGGPGGGGGGGAPGGGNTPTTTPETTPPTPTTTPETTPPTTTPTTTITKGTVPPVGNSGNTGSCGAWNPNC